MKTKKKKGWKLRKGAVAVEYGKGKRKFWKLFKTLRSANRYMKIFGSGNKMIKA